MAVNAPLTTVTPTFHANAGNLVFAQAHQDNIGDTHYRFHQKRDGRDVIGAELILHVRNGAVYAANGSVREDLTPNATSAAVSADDAVSAAKNGSLRLTNVNAAAADLAYLQH